jgi:monothiol glutaredoxin
LIGFGLVVYHGMLILGPNLSEDTFMQRVLLENHSERASKWMAGYHLSTVNEVRQAIADHAIVVVGMAHNPVVKKARQALEKADLEFHYLEYGNYFSMWRARLAIKLWSGWPTYPQVFVKGQLIGGANDLAALLEDGTISEMLASDSK